MPFTFTIDITAEDDEEQIKMGKVLVSIGQALAGPSHAVIRAAEISGVSNVVSLHPRTVEQVDSGEEAAKRKRRTKAEIEADKAAEAARGEAENTVTVKLEIDATQAVADIKAVSEEVAAAVAENEKAIVPAVGKDHVVAEVDNSDTPTPPTAAAAVNDAEDATNRVKLRALTGEAMALGLAPTVTEMFVRAGGQGPKSVPSDKVLVLCAEIEELIAGKS